MTRDSSVPASHLKGGAKKFLYSGPAKRNGPAQFDDDIDDREWNFNGQINATTNKLQHRQKRDADDFDVDSVWSIQKNVNIPNLPTSTSMKAPASRQPPTANAGKGYYSRHTMGGSDGSGLTGQTTTGSSDYGGKTWNQGGSTSSSSKTFSYSNNAGTNDYEGTQQNGPVSYSTSPRQPQGGTSYRGGGQGVSQGGRVANTTNRQYMRPN